MRLTILLALLTCFVHTQAHEHEKSVEFVQNHTQWDENVLYKCALGSGTVFVENSCLTYSFVDPQEMAQMHDLQEASKEEQDAYRLNGHAWKMHFIGGQSPDLVGSGESDHYYNYFTDSDPSNWSDHVYAYEKVDYAGLYEGIDMSLYSHNGNFKYDFIVRPGANPNQIQLGYEGLESLSTVDGVLRLNTSIGDFEESRPYAYQTINGKETQVACEYVLIGSQVSFIFPDGYDESVDLIIDPELIAATLSGTGGGASNYGHCATFDLEGNIYTGCVAGGQEYPATTGAFQTTYGGGFWDIGISKLNPEGTNLYWATFIGGSEAEYPHSMIVNTAQEIYVYGSTGSSDYPTTTNAYQTSFGGGFSDIIVSQLANDGASLVGSTFLGGSAGDGRNANSFNYGDTYRGEIILDYDEKPVIASVSESTDFPIISGAYQSSLGGNQDVVLFKLNSNLTNLEISTFLGGPENDTGYGIRIAVDGSIYIGGGAGEDFPTTTGAYQSAYLGPAAGGWQSGTDGFIAKLNATGSSLLAATYFGTDESDQIFFIDLDFDENIFAFGQGGGEIPVIGTVYSNPNALQFVAKFNSDLDECLISSTIGDANGNFVPDAFLVDNCDNIYISAYSAGFGLETTDDALFVEGEGGFYLAVFESDMEEIVFGTYYTGNHVDGGTSRFDKNGIVYQAVCSGGGFSTTDDAWATDQETGWDIGIFKIDFDASGVNAAVAANDLSGCAPFEITFENYSVGDQFFWDFGDGSTSTEYEPTYTYTDPGVYLVSLIASDSLSCNLADTSSFEITISTPQDFVPSFTQVIICADQEIQCSNTTDLDFLQYIWDMGDGTQIEGYDVTYQYDNAGNYTVSLLAIDNGCDLDEEITVDVTIEPAVFANIGSNGLEACDQLEAIFDNISTNAESYTWDFGDGTTSTLFEPEHTFTGPAVFEVILTANNPATCNENDTDTILVTIGATQVLELDFNMIQTDCIDFDVASNNQSIGTNCGYSWDMGDGTILNGFNITHSYVGIGTYNVTLTMTDTICNITDELTLPVDVNDEVVAIINNGDEIGCSPFTVDFLSGSPGVCTWDFGDGSSTEIGNAVSHLFDEPGIYTITMNVVGDSGCTGIDEVTNTVEVIEPPVIIPAFELVPIGDCVNMEFDFTNLTEGDADVFYWQFGDGSTSDVEDPTYSYSQQGIYGVTLTVWNSICEIEEEYSLVVSPDQVLDFELDDSRICPEIGIVILDTEIPGATYLWSTGDETQSIEVSEPGIYDVSVNLIGCWFSDELEVEYIETLELSRIITQCRTESNTLVIPYDNAISYLWDNGVEEQYMDVEETGLYGFILIDTFGCEHVGTIDATIEPNEANMFIPNSFSPNGDGINDFFRPVAADLQEYKLEIYNRWGELIFETEDLNQHWLGGVQEGEPFYVQDGIYSYSITYRSICSTEKIETHGSVTVIR